MLPFSRAIATLHCAERIFSKLDRLNTFFAVHIFLMKIASLGGFFNCFRDKIVPGPIFISWHFSELVLEANGRASRLPFSNKRLRSILDVILNTIPFRFDLQVRERDCKYCLGLQHRALVGCFVLVVSSTRLLCSSTLGLRTFQRHLRPLYSLKTFLANWRRYRFTKRVCLVLDTMFRCALLMVH